MADKGGGARGEERAGQRAADPRAPPRGNFHRQLLMKKIYSFPVPRSNSGQIVVN